MFIETLPLLRCPTCQQQLAATVYEADSTGDVLHASLQCVGCSRSYAIHAGIADLLTVPRPETPAQVVNEWRLTAWVYERAWRPFALTLLSQSPLPYRHELPLITNWVQAQHGGLLLDIACSNGLYARAMARVKGRAAGHVVAIDHSLAMLRDGQARARAANLRISFVRATAQALPFAPNAARGIVIGGSLNEIGDLDQCIAEVQRVLEHDGRFVAMSLVQASSGWGRMIQRALAPGGVHFLPRDGLLQVFEQHNLATEQSQQHGIVFFTASVRH